MKSFDPMGSNEDADTHEVESRIDAGDAEAEAVYRATAYRIAEGIGELTTVVSARIDRIVLTGAIAHSKRMVGWVSERVEFIAPATVVPGENELEALAEGTLRVLKGEETASRFVDAGDHERARGRPTATAT